MAEFTNAKANAIRRKPMYDPCKSDKSKGSSSSPSRQSSRRTPQRRRTTSQLPERRPAQIPTLPPPVVLPSPLAFAQGQQGLGGQIGAPALGGVGGALGGGGLGLSQQRPPAPLPPELLRLLTAQGSPLVP